MVRENHCMRKVSAAYWGDCKWSIVFICEHGPWLFSDSWLFADFCHQADVVVLVACFDAAGLRLVAGRRSGCARAGRMFRGIDLLGWVDAAVSRCDVTGDAGNRDRNGEFGAEYLDPH